MGCNAAFEHVERVPISQSDIEFSTDIARYRLAQSLACDRRVLDAACGTGYGSAILAEGAKAVAALDISDEALEPARSSFQKANISYMKGDVQRLPFADESFDLAVSFETIEHVALPVRCLSSFHRVLKRGGTLLVSTPNLAILEKKLNRVPNPYHLREYRPDEFTSLLGTVFDDIQILGQHLRGSLQGEQLVDANRSQTGETSDGVLVERNAWLNLIPASLKEWVLRPLPNAVKDAIFRLARGYHYHRRAEDFVFVPDALWEAPVLLAICRKEC